MCGIIAYKGNTDAVSIVVNGLKNLEYRGYDSWGIASRSNPAIAIIKSVGKIEEVKAEDVLSNLNLKEPSTMAIGHTRWATHGSVTQDNAHPHISEDGLIAVVHNGIIENYEEIRNKLESEGIKFYSQTDTEVIPQLIQHYMETSKDFEQAFIHAIRELQGSFAVVCIHQNSDKILFAKHGSPLVIGMKNNEYFIASDVPAFLNHTNKVIYVDDDEYGSVEDSIKIRKIYDDKPVDIKINEIDWDMEQAQKGNYQHFMLKEIIEQGRSIGKSLEQSAHNMGEVINLLKNSKKIFLVGCGTSYHACVSASYHFSHIAKTHVSVILGSEFRNYEDFLDEETLMIAVSQSGETADLLDAARIAKSRGVKVISVINVMGSSLQRLSYKSILMNAGPEICVCSTKSYTSQLSILSWLAYGLVNKLDEGKKLLREASYKVDEVIKDNIDKIKELAELTKHSKDYFLIGRDLAHPSALEGALKIKEVSYIHAEGFAGGELKHGTIALIEHGTPVIVFSTPETESLINSNASEIKSRGGYIIGIGPKNNKVYDFYIRVPDVGQANPILMIIPVQLLAYFLAVGRDCNPDKPRNLAKSVTVR